MAISNYGELKSAVADWAERSDLTTRIEDFIFGAHEDIARRIVLATDIDLESGGSTLPTDCREVVALYSIERPAVLLSSATEAQMTGYGAGAPRAYRIDSGELLFAPDPDTTYAGRLLYRLSRTFFSGDAATNTALTRYPMLYLHGALAELKRFLEDDVGAARYQGRFDTQLADIIAAESAQVTQGAMLQTASGIAV